MNGGGQGQVSASTVNCREPKSGQEMVQLCYKDDLICPSRYIIYLWIKLNVTCETNNPHPLLSQGLGEVRSNLLALYPSGIMENY